METWERIEERLKFIEKRIEGEQIFSTIRLREYFRFCRDFVRDPWCSLQYGLKFRNRHLNTRSGYSKWKQHGNKQSIGGNYVIFREY